MPLLRERTRSLTIVQVNVLTFSGAAWLTQKNGVRLSDAQSELSNRNAVEWALLPVNSLELTGKDGQECPSNGRTPTQVFHWSYSLTSSLR